jgi:hypothetical protein
MAPSATSAADKGFTGDGAVVSYLDNKGDNHEAETTMKLTSMALASAFALSSTCALAHTVRHKSNVRTHPMHSDATPSVVLHPKYSNRNGSFSGYGSRDVWGHWGAYYGPMIPTGAGGR